MQYRVRFVTFSGMTIPIGDRWSRGKTKDYVRNRLRRYRRDGYDVNYLGNGEWEFIDENAIIIGDDQGYLKVSRRRGEPLYCRTKRMTT